MKKLLTTLVCFAGMFSVISGITNAILYKEITDKSILLFIMGILLCYFPIKIKNICKEIIEKDNTAVITDLDYVYALMLWLLCSFLIAFLFMIIKNTVFDNFDKLFINMG